MVRRRSALSDDEPPAGGSSRIAVRVDTGGTFTDAIGVARDGRVLRAKVLSSSALRGRVERVVDGRSFATTVPWGTGDDVCRGMRLRWLSSDATNDATVVRFEAASGVVTVDGATGDAIAEVGASFELASDEPAAVLAARVLTGTPPPEPPPVDSIRLASTLGTNALLERAFPAPALFVTSGFADLLAIGNQARPDLFALDIRKPPPMYSRVVEVAGRLAADGTELEPLDLDAVRDAAERVVAEGVLNAAVVLMHAWRDPDHERAVCDVLEGAGFAHVTCSSDAARAIRIVERGTTAVVDAALAPVIGNYLDRIETALPDARLRVMSSAGGLAARAAFRPKDSLLSGPAGGVVGAATAASRAGFDRVLTLDMGGTSTDVARVADGDPEYDAEHVVGDATIVAPALAIETVAAGGGSVCWFDGDRLRVGPESAGATPGPACYGAGGPLTITDVNLLLGRVDPERFGIPVEREAAERALEGLLRDMVAGSRTDAPRAGDEVDTAEDVRPERDAVLRGLVEIADHRMADAIRTISVKRGHDPTEHALVAFGGAGPQHACGVAARLGISTVIVPPDTGLLSAVGLDAARLERFAEKTVLARLADEHALEADFADLEERASSILRDEGATAIETRRVAVVRFAGQDAALDLELTREAASNDRIARAFEGRYRTLFGHLPAARDLELVALRVVARERAVTEGDAAEPDSHEARPQATTPAEFDGRRVPAAVHERARLEPGARFTGPALVPEAHSVTVVPPGWLAWVDAHGALIVTRDAPADAASDASAGTVETPEAIHLELFTRRFESLVRDMGEQLRRTAVSTNVRERLDFSCGLLDPDGRLVANAPHIPVHLGALGLCVRSLRETIDLREGDTIVTNHPAHGGSHLPDVTVVTPAYADGHLLGYVASRAHHAEIGGRRPGSMPPDATCLADEGVVIPPTHVVRDGEARWDAMREVLSSGPFPSRAVDDNLADLAAAVAANTAGLRALEGLAREHGRDTVRRYMGELHDLAARKLASALATLDAGARTSGGGERTARDTLDDGTVVRVAVSIEPRRVCVDFEGSGAVHSGNLNATPAIVHSAVLYVLRLLIREPLPLNEGLLRDVELRIPEGVLNPAFDPDPRRCPAVVGGNVETSQRVVDTLIRALGLAACSQGTMNNLLFGNDRFGYYETIAGGAGAGPGFEGASAVHTHMTNTRITDPEVLEHRYPVRLERFAVRRGSGGAGRRRGGDGVVRELRFTEPVALSILAERREVGPPGGDGGDAGATGEQRVVRADGTTERLSGTAAAEIRAGDRVIVETPGGGGWGAE